MYRCVHVGVGVCMSEEGRGDRLGYNISTN